MREIPTEIVPNGSASDFHLLDEISMRQAAAAVLEAQLIRLRYLPRLPLFSPLWDIMLCLIARSEVPAGMPTAHIARELGMPVPSMCRWLAVLLQEELVAIDENHPDRLVTLTEGARQPVGAYLTALASGLMQGEPPQSVPPRAR